ncbi:hypothetical protein [Viridibacterium curvum]|uniref:Uncharacterized protein n=1 Tax=Viridibacterium curvum TaxID=1101404 RepID=A0ABP9QU87_9RHOO
MADPVKAVLSLEKLTSEYSVFERDQVLTEAQLNSVASYFDDQERLARVELLGVGCVGGLRVSIATGGKVRVSKGLGLTTDGDLLMLASDTLYDSFKPYDNTAPYYSRFYTGVAPNQTMLPVFELVREGESDVLKKPLATLPSALNSYVVVMYMESYELDHDLCSAADCDNLGIVATHTPRMLLVRETDAAALLGTISSLTDKASQLPVLVATRPQISGALTTTAALASLYLTACTTIKNALVNAVDELHKQIPVLTQDLFGGDPSPAWIAQLNSTLTSYSSNTSGIQYFYDYLKDLVETWNALRDALLDNDCVMCPDLMAFPKHLLLGALKAPATLRTGFYASPLTGSARTHLAHAHFLAQKLHVLINTFQRPANLSGADAVIVTPGRSELVSLEERAIPYYYAKTDSGFSLLASWSWLRSKRGTHTGITAYRAATLGASAAAQAPLTGQIGQYDFFRIEGHLGQNVDTVMDKLEAEIKARNLPFAVRAVLLHSSTGPIKRRPKIRYNDLHRIHKLFRAEVDTQLERATEFSKAFSEKVAEGAKGKLFPDEGTRATEAANTHGSFSKSAGNVRKALTAKRYSDFRADNTWASSHSEAQVTAANFKRQFGDIARTDYITALDTHLSNNHRQWLDWLDVLIDDKDKKADERVLLANYLKTHPGLEHYAGVLRGGTFVVVYNDSATVVADFMLPYRETEDAEDEADEPTLTPVVPDFIREGVKVLKPIEWRFDDLKTGIRDEWLKEINIQKDYQVFFKDSLGSIAEVVSKFNVGNVKDPGFGFVDTGDSLLNSLLEDLKGKANQLDKLRNDVASGKLGKEAEAAVKKQIVQYEQEIAKGVTNATQRMVDAGVSMAAGQPGANAVAEMGNALVKVKDDGAVKTAQAGLQTIANSAPQGSSNAAHAVANVVGIKF